MKQKSKKTIDLSNEETHNQIKPTITPAQNNLFLRGMLLILLGALLILYYTGILPFNFWQRIWYFWPALFIFWGLQIIVGNGKSANRVVAILFILFLVFVFIVGLGKVSFG